MSESGTPNPPAAQLAPVSGPPSSLAACSDSSTAAESLAIPPIYSKTRTSPQEEYKTLRDELIHIFNRVYVVLAAELAAFGVFTTLSMKAADYAECTMIGVLEMFMLVVGILVTCLLHQHAYWIGSYLIVYHEMPERIGWHFRSRRFRLQRHIAQSLPLRWNEGVNDSQFIAYVYSTMLVLTFVLATRHSYLELWTFAGSPAAFAASAALLFAASIGALLLNTLRKLYKYGARRSLTHWKLYQTNEMSVTVEEQGRDIGV